MTGGEDGLEPLRGDTPAFGGGRAQVHRTPDDRVVPADERRTVVPALRRQSAMALQRVRTRARARDRHRPRVRPGQSAPANGLSRKGDNEKTCPFRWRGRSFTFPGLFSRLVAAACASGLV